MVVVSLRNLFQKLYLSSQNLTKLFVYIDDNCLLPDNNDLVCSCIFENNLEIAFSVSIILLLISNYVWTKFLKKEQEIKQLKIEKKLANDIIYKMFPISVVEDLKQNKRSLPEEFESCTVFFGDIVGFTQTCKEVGAFKIAQVLNELFDLLDEAICYLDVYKVETIGDAYMVASGVPFRNGNRHAKEIATMAIKFQKTCQQFKLNDGNSQLKLRMGVHTGPVTAGVIGKIKPHYSLFGTTVIIAARMEQTSQGGKIQVSNATKLILESHKDLIFRERSEKVQLKGIGPRTTWWMSRSDSVH